MKKFLALPCLFCLLIVINSCSSDDDQEIMESASLIGTWNEINYRIEYFDDKEKIEEEYTENDEHNINRVTFKSDGTFLAYEYEDTLFNGNSEIFEETSTGTYSTDGEKLLLSYDEEEEDDYDDTVSSTFILNGDKLEIKTTTEYSDFTGPQSTIVTRNLERE